MLQSVAGVNHIRMKNLSEGQKEIIQHAADGIADILREDIDNFPVDELHNRLFNEDYFVIGYYAAEQFLLRCGGVFNAIGQVKEYEEDNFGVITTDLSSSEAVANMLAYIEGENMLAECPTFRKAHWKLSKKDLEAIIEELYEI
jgi:hypothetical protein